MIREQKSEIEFYQKLVKNLLKQEEIDQIRARSQNLEDSGWQIPPFVLKKHEVNFPKLSRGKAKAMVDDELNNREVEFEYNVIEDNSHLNSSKGSQQNTQHKKNTKSSVALQHNPGVMSPKKDNEMLLSYDTKKPSVYVSKTNSKSQRQAGKKNISVQPPAVNNSKNYMNYSLEEEENVAAMRSIKKPNPNLAPISRKKPMNMPDLSSSSNSHEVNIPSLDELRRQRGDLMPLRHHKLNDSFESK